MPEPINVVVDLSHYNGEVDLAAAKAAGLVGVIHKATQGLDGVDPTYATRREQARAAGLLWGAYHFATGGDGVAQAEHFLAVAGREAGTLLALDLEANPAGQSMPLEEARAFVTHVAQATGRYPGLYSGSYIKELLGAGSDPVLAQCWFWLAQYGPTAIVPPNWPTWTYGNTPMAPSATRRTISQASAAATATSSTATRRSFGSCGAWRNRP